MDLMRTLALIARLPTRVMQDRALDLAFGGADEVHYIPTMGRLCVCGDESGARFPARPHLHVASPARRREVTRAVDHDDRLDAAA